jgi:hypothetical protein
MSRYVRFFSFVPSFHIVSSLHVSLSRLTKLTCYLQYLAQLVRPTSRPNKTPPPLPQPRSHRRKSPWIPQMPPGITLHNINTASSRGSSLSVSKYVHSITCDSTRKNPACFELTLPSATNEGRIDLLQRALNDWKNSCPEPNETTDQRSSIIDLQSL